MRIAQVAPLYESVPPKLYGGTERVVSYLTEGLVAAGHDVTLYASGDSVTTAHLVAVAAQSLRLDPVCRDSLAYHHLMFEQVIRDRHNFDIIHFHTDYLHYSLARHLALRQVTTLHGRLDLPELGSVYREFPDMPVISISRSQQTPLPHARWIGTVYHGLPTSLYPLNEEPQGYLAFLGRVSPEKGLDRAIEIASRLGIVLRVAAKVDRADREYYLHAIAPLLHSPNVEFIGEISESEKGAFLGGARALLFPIDWPEPFGLVLIEAMACGTPIIGFRRGSVPELVTDGENGFLVEGVEQAAAAVKRLPELSRRRCREIFEERFSDRRMVEDYLAIYASVTGIEGRAADAVRGGRSLLDEAVDLQDQYYIVATESRADERTRVLKQGETFAVFDRFGDLPLSEAGEYGLYHDGTRYLSRSELRIEGHHSLLLSSTIRKARPLFTTDSTTPDLAGQDGTIALAKGVVHIFRTKFLWDGVCHERLQIANYGQQRIRLGLSILHDADFADIFEVRGIPRARRGQRLPNRVLSGHLVLAYRGLDDVVRRTTISCDPPPSSISDGVMQLRVDLGAGESTSFDLAMTCEAGLQHQPAIRYPDALDAAGRTQAGLQAQQCRILTSNDGFNEWLNRSASDLTMMMTERPEGLYPYAGVPWFSVPFGRDGIITALQFLWVDPSLAKGVLRFLAATQATEDSEASDAQPGKILHEARGGEMAALNEVPFARYYGSVDATPLYVMLAGEYFERTGDVALIRSLWPNLERALAWIERDGDRDRDGLVEYQRCSPNGLVNQGWKDSADSVSHADGSLPDGPIALCEVQGYVYAARRAAAALAAAQHLHDREAALLDQAELTREVFERAFWIPEMETYALALDGAKRPCRVRLSNAGHGLYARIAAADRAAQVAHVLAGDAMYSGWGIRMLAAGEARYNPMSYHNGSVWPHDNALIAAGLARYGFKDLALKIFSDLFEAASFLELRRMPELFCGFGRRPGEGPTLYPIACLPQAWAAAAVFMLLQAVLGLRIEGARRQVTFSDPVLPEWLTWLRIENLAVGDGEVDLLCERHPHDVGISVLRRDGDVRVVHVT